jgi:hypothetical protein
MALDKTSVKRPQTYDPAVLSEDERERLLAALGDGFGYSHRSQHLESLALPTEVEPGLLRHRAYYYKDSRNEYFGDADEDEFWEESDGDSPPGLFEQCPIGFHLPAIRKYFQEQKDAYLAFAKGEDDLDRLDDLTAERKASWEESIYRRVLHETYSKAWYEFHINEHLYFLDESINMLRRNAEQDNKLGLDLMLITNFSATLGRLIEQYYWKFLLEKAAMRGVKISESARSGGLLLASKRKREHAAWQSAARLVWQERPTSSKMTVAQIVKKRLKIGRSVKHISRVLQRPK